MPIYEFYCQRCNTIYNFFSKTINTEKIPRCPACKKVKLKRQMSVFAKIRSGKDDIGMDEEAPSFDEAKMEKAMAMLAGEAEKINEDDPRQATDLMRKLSEAAGVKMGPVMEEAMRRLGQGEDPEKIEAEMGDILAGEEPFIPGSRGGKTGSALKPLVDETLYDL